MYFSADFASFCRPFGVWGGPGVAQAPPWESLRTPRARPGCPGGVPGSPGSDFGFPRGPPGLRLGIHFEVILAIVFRWFFFAIFDIFLGTLGLHFGTILS